MRRRSELRQLLTGMSMSRYLPPMGTAGLDRCRVSGNSRVPRPPPRMTARTSFICILSVHCPTAPAPGPPNDATLTRMWFERRRRERPGIFRRAAAGAWHVPAGFVFLARTPKLWPLVILPAFLAVACVIGGTVLGLFAMPFLEKVLVPGEGKIADQVGFVLTLALWVGTLIAGMILGLAVALLLSAPILERISRQVEARVRGEAVEHSRGLGWEML